MPTCGIEETRQTRVEIFTVDDQLNTRSTSDEQFDRLTEKPQQKTRQDHFSQPQ